MSFFTGGTFQNLCKSALIYRSAAQITFQRSLTISSVDLAARKGTREKARKSKVKAEVKTFEFIPKKQRLLLRNAKNRRDRHLSDEHKLEIPNLNVYRFSYFKRKIYTFAEALDNIKDYNHPSMLNALNVPVIIQVQLNTQGEKKNRFMDEFHRTALVPHGFHKNERRTILVFSKDGQVQKDVIEAGATKAGGTELIKAIQLGELKFSNYEYILAQNSIMTDIIPLRGLLKKKFPSAVAGTLADDIVPLVNKFLMGVQYKMVRDIAQPNFGSIETSVGTLDMDPVQLEENAIAILKDINAKRPKREGMFITKWFVKGYPYPELFKLDPFVHVEKERTDLKRSVKSRNNEAQEDESEETTKEDVAVAN